MFTHRKTASKGLSRVSAVLLAVAATGFAIPAMSGGHDANPQGSRFDHRQLWPGDLVNENTVNRYLEQGPPLAHVKARKQYEKRMERKLKRYQQRLKRKPAGNRNFRTGMPEVRTGSRAAMDLQ